MATTVATWNVREGLAQPNEMPPIVEGIKRMDADVVVLSDAFSLQNDLHGSDPQTLNEAQERLIAAGYRLYGVEYDDGWHHDRNLVLLSRNTLEVADGEVRRFGARRTPELTIQDPETRQPVRIVGAHFDDRSEARRIEQADDFIGTIDPGQPTVLAGTLNTTPANTIPARLLRTRAMSGALACVPSARVHSLGSRLANMAYGDSYAHLEGAGLRDADPTHTPTSPAGFPILQLDHIMASSHIRVEDVLHYSWPKLSYHRAVIARLMIAGA